MKYLIGFVAGVAAAWSALAIWQSWEGVTEDLTPDQVPPIKPSEGDTEWRRDW